MELTLGTGDFLYYVGLTVISLLPVANPFSTAPLFLAITPGLSTQERARQAFWAAIYMTGILLAFLVAGALIMSFFGLTVPGIRIAGGLVISFIGFRMLFPPDNPLSDRGHSEATLQHDVAFIPLAMPSLSGPGSIAVVLGVSSEIEQPIEYLVVFLGILLTAILCWLILRGAARMVDILGQNGIDAVGRIMWFLLITIGVQFVAFGVRDFIIDPGFWEPQPVLLPMQTPAPPPS